MPPTTRIAGLADDLAASLNALPGVFSTPQWGGRAYKLPGPGGRKDKPKLLAHVCLTGEGDAVTVSFKLARSRAADVVERHAWVEPHSFRTLAPSGWVTATVTTRRHVQALGKLLAESREQYGVGVPEPPAATKAPRAADPVARRIDSVMNEARSRGWRPEAPGE